MAKCKALTGSAVKGLIQPKWVS